MPIGELGTLPEWLATHVAERPNAVAVSGDGADVTYAELAGDVGRLATGLAARGIGKGDVVAAQLPNNRAFLTVFLAAAACGAVFQPLHMPYRSKELRYLLGHAGAKIVFALSNAGASSPVAELLELKPALPALREVVAIGAPAAGAVSYDDLVSTADDATLPAVTPDDRYLMLYTSGTTADPKGVPHTSRAFLGNAFRSATELAVTPSSRVLSIAALSHLYGLFTVHLALAAGATVTLMPAFRPQDLAADIVRLSPTHIFAAPAHFSPLVRQSALTQDQLRTVEVLCLSGTTVPPPLAAAVDDLLIHGSVIQLWGMSELQAGAFGRPSDPLESRLTTAGRASPMTRLRVVSDTGAPVPEGVEGQLQVQGPSVFDGYLDNETETKSAFTDDGWFRTGDLATVDGDGFLTLTGRTKELINRGGVKYNPVEIELIVMGHPAVQNCAVVPFPDAVLGERACLCIEARDAHDVTLDAICALLDQHGVAKFKWPERLEIFDQLPMTPTRKVMRGALVQMLPAAG